MAKYKSLVSTLFIYNKICENVKKLENFEISTYLSEKIFSVRRLEAVLVEERSDNFFPEVCNKGNGARTGNYLPEKKMTQHAVKY